ncbi:hypothetical protein MATL_G00263300 [Megalops atlanticus]|uniref:Uncharacterized protein n=1 Tax=Megalops atlanticus TaxID=7932 RepID=A0A9D3P953_MEGAT|nr:hypothetical protein MATL_G00263300 [Megalops atlanticus]
MQSPVWIDHFGYSNSFNISDCGNNHHQHPQEPITGPTRQISDTEECCQHTAGHTLHWHPVPVTRSDYMDRISLLLSILLSTLRSGAFRFRRRHTSVPPHTQPGGPEEENRARARSRTVRIAKELPTVTQRNLRIRLRLGRLREQCARHLLKDFWELC